MRISLEIHAVLEGAGLAFIDVDRHQPGRCFAAHDAPLAARGETRAAEAAQPRILHGLEHALEIAPVLHAVAQQRIAAVSCVRGEVDVLPWLVGGISRLNLAAYRL